MPQFTPWAITNPAPNVLFNPAAVDQAIADTQSKLGDLDIRRQTLGLEQQKLDATQAGNRALLDGNTNTSPPADSTPFEQQMGAAEGGSDPAAVNKQGYAGQFQFGSQRLADLGLYTPAPGEGKNEWKGQFHIAPYNVATLDDFLKNPAAQHAAFVAHVANIDQAINATPGADKFDRNGLRAVAHLGGVGGMQAFVQSGGNLNSADANGTTLQNYYNRFAQGGAPLLQKTFGSVHGPGGPPSDLPAVRPGGNVSTAWVDPNAPLPVPPVPPATVPPPFNPNAGPRVAGAPPALPGAIVPPVTGGDPNAPVQIPPVGQARSGPIPPPPGGSADAAPVASSPIALRTGGTDVAGPGAGPDATLPAVAVPNQMYQTGIPGVTIGGPPSNTLAPPSAAAPAATTAPPPMAQAQAAPPAAQRPTLPQLSPPPSRAIQTEPLIQGGPFDGLTQGQAQAARAAGASLVPTATLAAQMQTWRQQNIVNRQTAATAAAAQQQAQIAQQQWLYEQQAKAGWVERPDGSNWNQYTGEVKYPPTPRGYNVPGVGFVVAKPGGDVGVAFPPNPAGIATASAAQSQGSQAGTDAAKQLTALAEQGREATRNIGTIDEASQNIANAQQHGITTGYLAPARAEILAGLKSIGVSTDKIPFVGADPSAIGDIQTARKALAIVSSGILKQALGDSQITDAKIEHFIHAQPGIETDPQAVTRVLNWARSQFVYENEHATAAMDVARNNNGLLPLNWQAQYYHDHGFAPIYESGAGEMQQPDGRSPPRNPAPTTVAADRDAAVSGQLYTDPKGATRRKP